jgi:hypothetical protein
MNQHDACTSGTDGSPSFHPKESFRIQFQQRLREHLARHGCAADSFLKVWERTSEQFTLDDQLQQELYWELVNWARNYELFTSADQTELLRRDKQSDSRSSAA